MTQLTFLSDNTWVGLPIQVTEHSSSPQFPQRLDSQLLFHRETRHVSSLGNVAGHGWDLRVTRWLMDWLTMSAFLWPDHSSL